MWYTLWGCEALICPLEVYFKKSVENDYAQCSSLTLLFWRRPDVSVIGEEVTIVSVYLEK